MTLRKQCEMNRFKKSKKNTCSCTNCKYQVLISPDTVKEKTFGSVIATYVECPVCGERLLKQLDTEKTRELAERGVKLEMLQRQGKKLSDKQKSRLKNIEKMLFSTRQNLKHLWWDEIYQSLNHYDESEKTEIADQELTLGNEVTSTEQAGERMVEHVI